MRTVKQAKVGARQVARMDEDQAARRYLRAGMVLHAAAVLGTGAGSMALGADNVWDGSGDTNWGTTANWSAGKSPTSADTVVFDSTSTRNLGTGLHGNYEIAGLKLTSPNGDVSLDDGNSHRTLTIDAGGIDLANAGRNLSLILSHVVVNLDQSWTTNGAHTLAVSSTVATDHQLTIAGTGGTSVSGVISGLGGLTKTGAGTLTLSGTNTYSGGTNIKEGVLQLSGGTDSLLNTGSAVLGDTSTSGKLILGNSSAAADQTLAGLTTTGLGGSVVGGNGTASVLTLNIAGTNTFGGILGGNGTNENNLTLRKTGAGTLTLSGANTYAGGTTVSAGTLNINNANALGTGTFTITAGAIDNTTTSAITNARTNGISVGGDFAFTGTSDLNLGTGAVALSIGSGGTRTITLNGTGNTLTFGGAVTGQTNIGGNGTLAVSGAGNTLVLGSLVTNTNTTARIFTINGSGNVTINGTVSGGATAEALTYSGTGTLTLSGVNGYTGATTVSGGVVRAVDGTGLPSGSNLTINGGVWESSASMVRATGTGAGQMQITGGTSGFSSYNASGVQVAFGSTGSPPTLTWGAATFNPSTLVLNESTATGSLTFLNAVVLGTSVRTVNVNANTATMSGALTGTGSGGLTKAGSGTLVLSNTANDYSGKTTINGGMLQFAKTGSLYKGVTTNWTAANLTVNAGTTAAFNVGGTGEFTTANIATLAALGTGTSGFKDGSAIGLDTTGGSFTHTTAIGNPNGGSNKLGVTKLGSGTLTLSGTNTYTGATMIQAGTLLVGSGVSLASGSAVTVANGNGATLAGSGTVNGTVTVSGTIAPGDTVGSISKLTTGAETWSSGGSYEVGLAKATPSSKDTPKATDGDSDQLVMSGLTLNNGFTVKVSGTGIDNSFKPGTGSGQSVIYDWVIARVSGGSAFDASTLNLQVSGFSVAHTERYHFSLLTLDDSKFGGTSGHQDVVLRYDYSAVPEATTLLLGIAGLAPMLLHRRRRVWV